MLVIVKSITISALNPRGAILDGQNERRVMYIMSGTVVLDGLDITNGFATPLSDDNCYGDGGGVHIIGGTVTFNDCNIYSNQAYGVS